MAPMTKEEWEKRQSVVRKVLDEETGRYRLSYPSIIYININYYYFTVILLVLYELVYCNVFSMNIPSVESCFQVNKR